ncbi:RsmF rRNA methyltransferase first C-terminal domain-containing protein, partial [Paenibacillus sp. GYB003]|uniref:RsmF rRNA methyltransferase first C-terminal domain-containing protein n=1 Tax=Paenibacillus sp. GYB003 TaxID=2994392 RepID=UPI002F96D5E3
GMFRKDPEAIREWSPDHVRMCAARQLDILDSAAVMLKPGGTLAYSTCTFNRTENEDVLAAFTAKYPAFAVLRTERLWPHRVRGEGHFVALLRKGDGGESAAARGRRGGKPAGAADKSVREAMRLAERMMREVAPSFSLPPGEPALFGEQLYWLPAAPDFAIRADDLDGVKTLRPGLQLAHIKKGRAEPAHALAMAITPDMCRAAVSLPADAPELETYLKGGTIPAGPAAAGWTLVAVEGHPVGWGKASGGLLKNHLPKGLRLMGG